MSASPTCPLCGQRMRPTDLRDAGSEEIVGTCWKCPCGYQDPRYKDGYWARLEAEAEEQERREREEDIAAMEAAHPDRFQASVLIDGSYVAIGAWEDADGARAWVDAHYHGRKVRIQRQTWIMAYDYYHTVPVPVEEWVA